MIDTILLETPVNYETGVLTLQLDRKIEIKILPEEARRRVNYYTHMEISTQMHAETPMLVVGAKVAWRVPVHLTFPSFGDVGQVGFMDVDPVTGEIDISDTTLEQIIHEAETLALRFTSPAANRV
jgi:hypothetical protein